MKIIFLVPAIAGIIAGCAYTQKPNIGNDTSEHSGSSYRLVWSDEFDYNGLPDSSKWAYDTEGNHAGWGNNEAQYYTSEREKNAKVENGVLRLIAHKEPYKDKEYTSARLVSKGHWQYGRIEVKAKLPPGTGTWSAIWLMPEGWSFKDGNWPDIGEIDIMEHVGHD